MASQVGTFKVECPHPDCQASLGIKTDLPSGEYQCHCHSCLVRLSWATYLDGGIKPQLSLANPYGVKDAAKDD